MKLFVVARAHAQEKEAQWRQCSVYKTDQRTFPVEPPYSHQLSLIKKSWASPHRLRNGAQTGR